MFSIHSGLQAACRENPQGSFRGSVNAVQWDTTSYLCLLRIAKEICVAWRRCQILPSSNYPALLSPPFHHLPFFLYPHPPHPFYFFSLSFAARSSFYLFLCIFFCTVKPLIPFLLFRFLFSGYYISSLFYHPSIPSLPHPLSFFVVLIFCHMYVVSYAHISSCFVTPLVQRLNGQYRTS